MKAEWHHLLRLSMMQSLKACNCRRAVVRSETKEATLGRVASSWQVSSHTPGMLLRWQTVRPFSVERPARGHGLRLLQPWHSDRELPRSLP